MVAISQMCAGDFQQYHDVAAERIRLVYHGVDVERFSPWHRELHREPVRDRLGIGQEEVVVLFVGHDYRRKGLATAVRAVQRLAPAARRSGCWSSAGGSASGVGPWPQRRGAR